MSTSVEIRRSVPSDSDAIERLYQELFPGEDLLPLVRELLTADEPVVLSLVAAHDGDPVGHIAFTTCSLAGSDAAVALLGPLAVAPAQHGRGIGGQLVDTGLSQLREAGIGQVFVYGDPAYYGRFGFESDDEVVPPYRTAIGPGWQSVSLHDDLMPMRTTLYVPPMWQRPGLWAEQGGYSEGND